MHAKVEEPLRELGCFNLGAIFTGSNKKRVLNSLRVVSRSVRPFQLAVLPFEKPQAGRSETRVRVGSVLHPQLTPSSVFPA